MLKQRVLTAIALLLILLPAVWSTRVEFFLVVTLVLICAAAWEWGRLSDLPFGHAVALGVFSGALGLGCWLGDLWSRDFGWFWALVAGVWVIGSVYLLSRGMVAWSRWPARVRASLGTLVLLAAWLALVQARQVGVNFLLSSLALVWAADIGAYFAGRSLGGRWFRQKLAPSISPGKTWEGVIGGAVVVWAVSVIWRIWDRSGQADSPSLYTALAAIGEGWLLLALACLVCMSVVGDLVESLIKRAAGVKDSSRLLPGHGGVLDRVDALLPTLPWVMLLTYWAKS